MTGATLTIPSRGRRHTIRARRRALELYQSGGWSSYAGIAHQLLLEGLVAEAPARNTVMQWCNPVRERAQAKRITARNHQLSAERRLARIRALDATGLAATSIAKVMKLDYPGEAFTRNTVRIALEDGRLPQTWRPGGRS